MFHYIDTGNTVKINHSVRFNDFELKKLEKNILTIKKD